MNALLERFDSFLLSEFQTLLLVSAIASITVVVALLIHRVLENKVSSSCLGLLWLLVLCRFVLFIAPESPTSWMNLMPKSSEPVFESTEVAILESSVLPTPISLIPDVPIVEIESEIIVNQAIDSVEFTWMAGLKIIWMLGVFWLTVLLGLRYFRLRKIVGRTTLAPEEIQSLFESCKHDFGFTRYIGLRISPDIQTPAMTGFFRPAVLLPTWAVTELSVKQLKLVFIHELIHIRRHDGIVQLASYAVSVLHWFNPLVHIALKRIESCRELSCDKQVLQTLGNIKATQRLYGQTILQIAERSCGQRNTSPVLVGGFIGNDNRLIKQRIAMLVNSKPPRKFGLAMFAVCTLVLVAVGFTTAQTQDEIETKETAAVEAVVEQPVAVMPVAEEEEPQPERMDFEQGVPVGIKVDANIVIDFDFNVLQVNVEDPKVVRCNPVTPSSLRLTGLKPGVTSIMVHESVGVLGPKTGEFAGRRHHLVFYTKHNNANHEKRVNIKLNQKLNAELERQAEEVAKASDVGPIRPVAGKSYSITTGSSRFVKCDFRIPEVRVDDPKVVSVTPVSPTELLLTAIKPGEAKVVIWNEKREKIEVKIVVSFGIKKLWRAIEANFPFQNIRAKLEGEQVVLTGDIESPECRGNLLALVGRYFPGDIVDKLKIKEGKAIDFEIKVFEVSTAKLKGSKIDFRKFGLGAGGISKISDLISKADMKSGDIAFQNIGKDDWLYSLLKELQENGVAKLKAEPLLVSKIGAPAEFFSGIEVSVGAGTGKKMVPVGTTLNLLARSRVANGKQRLTVEIRAEYSVIAQDLAGASGRPGFRVRRVNTGLRSSMGDTIVLLFESKTADGEDIEVVFLVSPKPPKVLVAKKPRKPKKSNSDF